MDYYQTLGVPRTASQEEIKKAYKKLAMQHHPDRGGDTAKFQEISQAYDTLGNPEKKAQYDNPMAGHFGGARGVPPGFENFEDIFSFAFGPGFANASRDGGFRFRKNRDLTIKIGVTLKQSYTGTQIEARFKTPSGKDQTVVVDIPAGVHTGQLIRYPGLGDDSIPNIQKGNLNVQVIVEPDAKFFRKNYDLVTNINLSVIEAMTGCTKEVENIDGSVYPVKIRPGVQHGTEYAAEGKGFKDLTHNIRGNFVMVINVDIPSVTDPDIIKQLEEIYAKLGKK